MMLNNMEAKMDMHICKFICDNLMNWSFMEMPYPS